MGYLVKHHDGPRYESTADMQVLTHGWVPRSPRRQCARQSEPGLISQVVQELARDCVLLSQLGHQPILASKQQASTSKFHTVGQCDILQSKGHGKLLDAGVFSIPAYTMRQAMPFRFSCHLAKLSTRF